MSVRITTLCIAATLITNLLCQSSIKCPFGHFLSTNNQCTECLSSCSKCTNVTPGCPACSEGFWLDAQTSQCSACHVGQLACQGTQPACQPYYSLVGTTCRPTCFVPECLECQSILSTKCSKCKDGFTLSADATACVANRRMLQSVELPPLPNATQLIIDLNKEMNISMQVADEPATSGLLPNKSINLSKNQSGVQFQTNVIGIDAVKTLSLSDLATIGDLEQGVESIKSGLPNATPLPSASTPSNPVPSSTTSSTTTTTTLLDSLSPSNDTAALKTRSLCLGGVLQPCVPCSARCATCINTADQCLECAPGYVKNGWKCVTNTTVNFTISMEGDSNTMAKVRADLPAYLNQIKDKFLGAVAPEQYQGASRSIITVDEFTVGEGSNNVTLTGMLDRIHEETNMTSVAQEVRNKLNSIGNLSILAVRGYRVNNDRSRGLETSSSPQQQSQSTIKFNEALTNEKTDLARIIIPIVIGGIALLALISGLYCYYFKKACFKQEPTVSLQSGTTGNQISTQRQLKGSGSIEPRHTFSPEPAVVTAYDDKIISTECLPNQGLHAPNTRQQYNSAQSQQVYDYAGNPEDPASRRNHY